MATDKGLQRFLEVYAACHIRRGTKDRDGRMRQCETMCPHLRGSAMISLSWGGGQYGTSCPSPCKYSTGTP